MIGDMTIPNTTPGFLVEESRANVTMAKGIIARASKKENKAKADKLLEFGYE